MPTFVEKQLLGTIASLLTTELNSLANNVLVLSTNAYDNTVGGGGGDGYVLAHVQLTLGAPGGTLVANTGCSVWFIQKIDGTNYEDGAAGTTPARPADVIIPVRASTAAQFITVQNQLLPCGVWKTLVKNDATGQTWAASGNTLKIIPVTRELVGS